jgi:uncharacterized membrane protein
MPFDNTPADAPRTKIKPATDDPGEFLDLLLQVFKGGKRWTQGTYYKRKTDSRCLVGGINHVRRTHRFTAPSAHRATAALCEAIMDLQPSPFSHTDNHELNTRALISYNDSVLVTFTDIRKLIREARKIVRQTPPTTRRKQSRTKIALNATLYSQNPSAMTRDHAALLRFQSHVTEKSHAELMTWAIQHVERLLAEYTPQQKTVAEPDSAFEDCYFP